MAERPSRRVFLHIGAPKTGTTYLQDRLALNRSELSRHGVEYPLGLHSSQFRAALDLIDRPWGGLREQVRGEWESLVGRVRRCDGTVVVSHEILAGARPGQIKQAMADFADSEVHLVYSARDLGRQIPAEWQEGIKHRRIRSFGKFVKQVQAARRTKPTMWFWRVQGLPDVLGRWTGGLPPGHVHLVTVPRPGGPPDELWNRYCTAFGIDPAWAPLDGGRANVSIGTAETTLLRKLNRRLKKAGVGSEDYRRLVRDVIVHETLAAREPMIRTTLPPWAHPWAAEVAEEWIEWVEGSGIHVIGDVEDLRPVLPDQATEWDDPDRPKRVDMVDAALDALVAITVEAASRPDPRVQITAKLGRAARRLRGQ
ncbi:MAG TPA: hypothetical protein VFJ19_19030 [Nocardioidaceae bacterium]|nr:hypothetical protein [Nocardioidaceae bacterium]